MYKTLKHLGKQNEFVKIYREARLEKISLKYFVSQINENTEQH